MTKAEHPISWRAIGRIITALAVVFFIIKTLGILILILVSAMMATALYPLVQQLHRKLPLVVSIIIVLLLLLIPFIILGISLVPVFTTEFPNLLKTLDTILNKSAFIPPQVRNFDFTDYVQSAGTYLLQSTTLITTIATSTVTLLFLTFYLIYDAERLLSIFISLFSPKSRPKISRLLSELGEVNGQYIRGNLIISGICGVTIYIGLMLLQIPYALPLAIFAAIFDLLPLVGSTIAMIPAIIIAFAISPLTALLVIALYVTYQQIESTLLAPTIYKKALRIYPSLSFIAVIIGAALYGVIGAFLALPVAASIPVVATFISHEVRVNRTPRNR
jgi:predicted PurR-regulated permease PerM